MKDLSTLGLPISCALRHRRDVSYNVTLQSSLSIYHLPHRGMNRSYHHDIPWSLLSRNINAIPTGPEQALKLPGTTSGAGRLLAVPCYHTFLLNPLLFCSILGPLALVDVNRQPCAHKKEVLKRLLDIGSFILQLRVSGVLLKRALKENCHNWVQAIKLTLACFVSLLGFSFIWQLKRREPEKQYKDVLTYYANQAQQQF